MASLTPAYASKMEADRFEFGASALGAVAVVGGPDSGPFAFGVVAPGVQGTWLTVSSIWDTFAEAPANPDPNHAVAAARVPVTFTPTPVVGAGPAFDAIDRLLVAAGDTIADSMGLDISSRRFFGAVTDNNTTDTALQQATDSGLLFGFITGVILFLGFASRAPAANIRELLPNGFIPVSVPEPSTFALLGTGILAMIGSRWRHRSKAS